jgi:transcriptional regulator with XRE-family HTH domain
MNLSEKIRYLRIQKGMTQAELAEKLNTTKQTIGKYENQVVTNLPLNRIQELADALDTTPAYLMGWGEEKPADASSADELDLTILSLVKQLPEEQKRFLLAQLRGVTGEK